MADHYGIKIPTHHEVAKVLEESHPDIAEFVSRVGTEAKDTNCWGDMVFIVQRDFPLMDVASAFRRLELKGWGLFICKVFCPVTEEMVDKFRAAKHEEKEIEKLPWLQRVVRRQTVLGGLAGAVLKTWMRTRREWMKEHNVLSNHDPEFMNKIVRYLRDSEKGQEKCVK